MSHLLARSGRRALALLAAVLAAGTPARADGDPFGRGALELGLHGGYSFPYRFYPNRSEVEESESGALIPRVGVGLSDALADDRWYRGNVELLFEGAFLFQNEPRDGFGAGATLLFRYNFLRSTTLVPFVEIGSGLIDLDYDLDRRADGFNFTPQGGVGLHWFATERAAITAQWRYHHISNAGIRDPNVAIDSNLLLLGFTVFPR